MMVLVFLLVDEWKFGKSSFTLGLGISRTFSSVHRLALVPHEVAWRRIMHIWTLYGVTELSVMSCYLVGSLH